MTRFDPRAAAVDRSLPVDRLLTHLDRTLIRRVSAGAITGIGRVTGIAPLFTGLAGDRLSERTAIFARLRPGLIGRINPEGGVVAGGI
jgi:hypothetical protein